MSLRMERNADDGFRIVCKRDAMACHASYRILITRVTRTAVPTYFTDGLYARFTARGGRPRSIMAVENGPSIDSCTPGYLHVEDGWLH